VTHTELRQALEEIGYPVAYSHFKEPQTPPFMVFLFGYSNDFMADGANYHQVSNYQVELYTKYKEPPVEENVQAKLKEIGLPYSKIETYIEDVGLFQIIYRIQI